LLLDIQDSAAGRTIALRGDLDTAAAQDLDDRAEALTAGLEADLVVDLGGLSYLNSAGIRSFIRLDTQLKPRGRRLVFRNAAPRLIRIFQYCGLDGYFAFQGA
jgi:anti-anti-sigma factor